MAPGLLELLRSRFTFVVGKGGVGKTTTAGAVALGLAEAGQPTLLVSTDPAHSLGDLFEQALGPEGVAPSRCSPSLTLEELDTHARGERWVREAGDAVAELLDRGTYLDEDDVRSFLDRTLPGVDEVMAALRLAELADAPEFARVVVDTAPTGHTLRLLESDRLLVGWAEALEATARKAAVVASQLLGRRVRFAGEQVLADLRRAVDAFRNAVLGAADVVVVTREDEVVEAETARLVERLTALGLSPVAVVDVGGAARPGSSTPRRLAVPLRADLTGCEGLGRWGRPAEAVVGSGAGRMPGPGIEPPGDSLDRLRRLELALFAGKGGVGKSTCAAAWALSLAEVRDVVLVSADPAGSLGDLLGVPVGWEGTAVTERLRVRQIESDRQFAAFQERYRTRLEEVFRRLGLERGLELDRRVLESLLDLAPPGIDEVFALDALLDGQADGVVLVVDTAPTGHFLRLLDLPATAQSWTHALLEILIKYRAVLGLDDFAGDVLQFAKRLKGLVQALLDPSRTGAVVVTAPGALPRRETERLLADLSERRTPVAAVIHNRVRPDEPPARLAAPLEIAAPLRSPPPMGVQELRGFVELWRPLQ